MHGLRDEIIPYRHGKTLAAAALNSKLVSFESGHNDLPTGGDRFWQEIDEFLRQIQLFPDTPPGK